MSSECCQKKGASLKFIVSEFDCKQERSSGWERVDICESNELARV